MGQVTPGPGIQSGRVPKNACTEKSPSRNHPVPRWAFFVTNNRKPYPHSYRDTNAQFLRFTQRFQAAICASCCVLSPYAASFEGHEPCSRTEKNPTFADTGTSQHIPACTSASSAPLRFNFSRPTTALPPSQNFPPSSPWVAGEARAGFNPWPVLLRPIRDTTRAHQRCPKPSPMKTDEPKFVDQLSGALLLRTRARALISVHQRSSAVPYLPLPPRNYQNRSHDDQLDNPDHKPLCRGESIKKNRATMDAPQRS